MAFVKVSVNVHTLHLEALYVILMILLRICTKPQGGDTPLYRIQLSSSTGQNKVNGQLGIFSIVNGQATIFL